jgi:AAA family ATP:ADP antiporter
MVRPFFDIRPGERRSVVVAFLVLFGVLASHTVLETARDALFLSRLPPSQLPWVYLAMAGIAVLLSQGWATRLLSGSRGLPVLLVLCSFGTSAFWFLGVWENPWALKALYVWTGLVSTLAAVKFWLVIGDIYTITQAKRLYGIIGLGSLLGAVVGGGLARLVSVHFDAHHLLLVSGVLMALTGLGPAMMLRQPVAGPQGPRDSAETSLSEGVGLIRGHPYLARLAGLVLISTVAVTLADYVFKSAVSRAVAPAELGSFFATFYTILNVLALGVQLLLVRWLLQVLGLHRAIWVLPALLFLGAAGVALGGGLAAALLLKGADGALRPSLNRMSTELLFLPIPDHLRARAKPLTDVLGQRGGQALASLLILGEASQHRGDTVLLIATAILCVLWIGWVADLRPHYLGMFRTALRDRSMTDSPILPDLDLGALEVLFAALNSQNDEEVLGALDVLAEEGRAHLIPALILYHPSPSVVFHALRVFTRSGRVDFVPIADRLLLSPDAEIRAAALRARAAVRPDEAILRSASHDPSPLVRATALAGLVAGGWGSQEVHDLLREILEAPSPETQVAFARAIERQPSPAFTDVLLHLADSPDASVLRHVAHAMGNIKSERFLPKLLSMLESGDNRAEARAAFLRHGPSALHFLDLTLDDQTVPHRLRRHIPRTISRFPPDQAAPILLKHLLSEPDGMVRFRILRGLGRIAADHPDVPLDSAVLKEATKRTIEVAVKLIGWRTHFARGAAQDPQRVTPGYELLVTLLRDKEADAVERLFRLLGLTLRGEDLRSIHRGLKNKDPKVRAGSRELLENIIEPLFRTRVLALVDDAPDEQRLAQAQPDRPNSPLQYETLLSTLIEERSETLRSLAAYHAAELGLRAMRERVDALEPTEAGRFATQVMDRARGLLSKREG